MLLLVLVHLHASVSTIFLFFFFFSSSSVCEVGVELFLTVHPSLLPFFFPFISASSTWESTSLVSKSLTTVFVKAVSIVLRRRKEFLFFFFFGEERKKKK